MPAICLTAMTLTPCESADLAACSAAASSLRSSASRLSKLPIALAAMSTGCSELDLTPRASFLLSVALALPTAFRNSASRAANESGDDSISDRRSALLRAESSFATAAFATRVTA